MENPLNKEKVWFHLLNFSKGKGKYLNSAYFQRNLVRDIDLKSPEGKEELKKTQRILADIVEELINDLKTLQSEHRIVSSNAGYKIAADPEELEEGWNYLYSKVDEMLKRINWLKEGYKSMVRKNRNTDRVTEDIFAQNIEV
ncbi:MAG: hypothetical protein KGZ42_07350 [Melioribacter sp.]|nr:hypothetical protein [Melioribacter sp.]